MQRNKLAEPKQILQQKDVKNLKIKEFYSFNHA